jgi:hypothetical protein
MTATPAQHSGKRRTTWRCAPDVLAELVAARRVCDRALEHYLATSADIETEDEWTTVGAAFGVTALAAFIDLTTARPWPAWAELAALRAGLS